MSKYTVEFKETILTKLLTGDYTSITELAKHYNISKSTLYDWKAKITADSKENIMKNKAQHKKTNNKAKSSLPANKLNEAQKKLNIIIATATINEAELSSDLIEKIVLKENVKKDELTLHSDDGSPMTGYTMKAKLEHLGVIASYSRPAVSNDNAFSERLFGSMKTRKQYPRDGFKSIEDARDWVLSFVDWYNNEHRHSGIKYVTHAQRHQGIDGEILANRKKVY